MVTIEKQSNVKWLFITAEIVKLAVPQTKNLYKGIAENKDVAKYVMMLSSAVSALKADVVEALQRYSDYSFLWEQDRNETVAVSVHYRHYSDFV